MIEQNLRSISKLKFKKTTNSSHLYTVTENILNQDFQVNSKNKAWVSDITYIRTDEGWLYLTIIIDLYDRKVIGVSLSENLSAKDTSISSFKMALLNRPIENNEKVIFHSDRGIQYACKKFISLLTQNNQVSQSMSGKGNCYDNAAAESFFKTLKIELVYQNTYQTKKKAKESVFEYIEKFYNTRRRHSALWKFNH